jgi:hypothetical protein
MVVYQVPQLSCSSPGSRIQWPGRREIADVRDLMRTTAQDADGDGDLSEQRRVSGECVSSVQQKCRD